MMRVNDEDCNKYIKSIMFGRIRSYDHKKGFGWIYTEIGKDVLASSYEFVGKDENKVCIGTYVKFILDKYENKIVARQIEIVSNMDKNEIITFTDDVKLPVRKIKKIVYESGRSTLSKLGLTDKVEKEEDEYNLFDSLVIKENVKEYRFFNYDCPIEGDGRININEVYEWLKEKFWYIS